MKGVEQQASKQASRQGSRQADVSVSSPAGEILASGRGHCRRVARGGCNKERGMKEVKQKL